VDQLPAAEAVIAALYGVPESLSSLDQVQLVHAMTIADMVHAEAVVKQAVEPLETAPWSDEGLSAAALQVLAGIHACAACMPGEAAAFHHQEQQLLQS
jgi:hypothetical protein